MCKNLIRKQAPLPFQGQKRNFVVRFAHEISNFPDNTIFVDLFGGSGLLSRTAKDIKPNCRVIYNDFDSYHSRIENIPTTNALLNELRPVLANVPKAKLLPPEIKKKTLEIIERYEFSGYVDYITLSASILFSMKYATSLAELRKMSLYNNIKQSDYNENSQYLKGLEIRNCDYKLLYNEFKDNPQAFFICDPPYLSTDVKTYKMYWKLRDYLDVLKCLKGNRFAYFTSDKSNLVELLEWMQKELELKNPFDGAKIFTIKNTLNHASSYNDIMIFKNGLNTI